MSHDPGGKLTLFDVLSLTSALCGALFGFQWVHARWGVFLGLVAALAGLYLGGAIGRIPVALSLWHLQRVLSRTETPMLRRRLESEYFLSHFFVAELLRRGTPATELLRYTLALLTASEFDKRWHGWRTLHLCFPGAAATLQGINLRALSPSDVERIRALDNLKPRG